MPPIRNSCVARGTAPANSNTIVYTVPANSVFLLKSVLLDPAASGAWGYQFALVSADGSTVLTVASDLAPSVARIGWSGWLAMNAGDSLRMYAQNVANTYWVSGALLPFIPGF